MRDSHPVQDQPPLDLNLHRPLLVSKRPRKERSAGEAKSNAIVRNEVARSLWLSLGCEVSGRTDDHDGHFIADSHGNHVARETFSGPNSGIETSGDNVGQTAVFIYLQGNFRV